MQKPISSLTLPTRRRSSDEELEVGSSPGPCHRRARSSARDECRL
jgi:hypothetical protein